MNNEKSINYMYCQKLFGRELSIFLKVSFDIYTTLFAKWQKYKNNKHTHTHTTLFTFGKGSTIIRKKNESEHLTNQQHETLKNAT